MGGAHTAAAHAKSGHEAQVVGRASPSRQGEGSTRDGDEWEGRGGVDIVRDGNSVFGYLFYLYNYDY